MLSTALLTKRWLGDPKTALSVLISLGVWQFGSSMLIFLAAIKNIPASFHEAAIVDGAGPVKRFFSINLPMITPILFFNLINQVIGSFQAFNGTHDWYNAQCDMFARHGIMAYCFHFCGGCTRSQRSGKSKHIQVFARFSPRFQIHFAMRLFLLLYLLLINRIHRSYYTPAHSFPLYSFHDFCCFILPETDHGKFSYFHAPVWQDG